MKLKPLLAASVIASSFGTACDPSPVLATRDPRQSTETARIEGEIVVTGRARGNVVLFLFRADRPPPPQGTGRPISFTVIPGEQVFGNAMDDATRGGPFSAPFAFSLVPEGRYILRGFVDSDANFNPWYGVTGEPSAGDVGGSAVDALTLAPRVLEIARGEDGALEPVVDAHVMFAESATLPVDRPAFRVNGERVLDTSKPATVLRLSPQTITTEGWSLESPGFLARYVDDNADGIPDDANGDGIPELWPKVVVRKLADADPPLADENDVNRDGVIDDEGADYLRADGKKDGKADLVVLAAGLLPDAILPALTHEDGTPNMAPVPVPELAVAIRPMALDLRNPAAPAPLQKVPAGRYALVLIQFTGQTWRVPNELQPAIATEAGLPSLDTQAFVIEVE